VAVGDSIRVRHSDLIFPLGDVLWKSGCFAKEARSIVAGIEDHEPVIGQDEKGADIVIIGVPVAFQCVNENLT
jgi:hypothetical protein